MIVTKTNSKFIRQSLSNVLNIDLNLVATGSNVETDELIVINPVNAVFDEALLEAEVQSLQDAEIANQYQRDRKAKYDALNQLELISDDAINGTTTHKDAILAIKAEIPKPTGE